MSVSVLGGVKSGMRMTDAYERTRKDFQDEIVSEVEKVKKRVCDSVIMTTIMIMGVAGILTVIVMMIMM